MQLKVRQRKISCPDRGQSDVRAIAQTYSMEIYDEGQANVDSWIVREAQYMCGCVIREAQ